MTAQVATAAGGTQFGTFELGEMGKERVRKTIAKQTKNDSEENSFNNKDKNENGNICKESVKMVNMSANV